MLIVMFLYSILAPAALELMVLLFNQAFLDQPRQQVMLLHLDVVPRINNFYQVEVDVAQQMLFIQTQIIKNNAVLLAISSLYKEHPAVTRLQNLNALPLIPIIVVQVIIAVLKHNGMEHYQSAVLLLNLLFISLELVIKSAATVVLVVILTILISAAMVTQILLPHYFLMEAVAQQVKC
jgi:hypothetical protein